ncbi:PAS domain S-box-containing protein/diguanylate cyclase (GGDEF) domain-containing protein [Methylomagnum ishizawai]|uniref:diguanylate cyclase n=1 Tax=Methylomagnum ishizawai TaxID=1760988 RepID=A0A1Y6D1Q4_9GAMM|nr:diguanylate cyclase [Methylomagnum ishizawai]SMF96340.1 PAS domain S-box-containing protein/diguanylate cyclase (GGDEF) domain-containing protein [Methylomagnum ishizawai]
MPPSAAFPWIDPIPHPVLLVALDGGRAAFANRRAREKLGTTAQPGPAAAIFSEPDDLARLLETARTGPARLDRVALKSAEGTHVWCRVEAERTVIEGREYALLTLADAQDAPADPRSALWRAVFDQAGIGIVLLDAAGRFLDANPRWLELFGYTWDDARALRPSASLDQGRIGALLRGETAQYRVEQAYVRQDGTPFWGDLSVGALRDAEGAARYVMGFLLDITAHKRAEDQLHEANERLEMQLLENQRLQEQLAGLAIRDGLTGLFNRRYMEATLHRELSRVGRDNQPLSIVAMQIDQRTGDPLLKTVAGLLHSQMRGADLACRYDDAVFVAVLPGAPLLNAARRAESWRTAVEALAIDHAGETLCCTVSIGIAEYPRHGLSGDQLLAQADSALRLAQEAGRNRVVTWG